MTISVEPWHAIVAAVMLVGWLYVQFIRPLVGWQRKTDLEVQALSHRVMECERQLGKGDEQFACVERTLREILARLAAIETVLRERGGIPPGV